MDEAGIVDMVSKEPSWEEVIEYVVAEEGMDPWDVDVVELADAFRDYVEEMGKMEFKVPARLVMVAAVLLHMKAEILVLEDEEEQEQGEQDKRKDEGEPIDTSDIPDIEVPAKRVPTRRVTLDELVDALDKAFTTRERRERKTRKAKEQVEEVVEPEEFDIEDKIDDLYRRIDNILQQMEGERMEFRELVPVWEKREVIESLMGLLHISSEGEVTLEQEEAFGEVYVKISEKNPTPSSAGGP